MTVRQWFREMRAADFARDIPPALGGSLLTEWGHWTLFDTQREVDKATTGHYWPSDCEFWFALELDDVAMPVLLPRPLDQKPALEEQWAQKPPIFSSKVPTSSRPITFDDLHQALALAPVREVLPSRLERYRSILTSGRRYTREWVEGSWDIIIEPIEPQRDRACYACSKAAGVEHLSERHITHGRLEPCPRESTSGFEAALLADDEESRRDRAGQIHEGQPPTADHVSCPVSRGLDPAITAPLDVEAVRRVFQPKPRVYKRDGVWWCADGYWRIRGETAAGAIANFFAPQIRP